MARSNQDDFDGYRKWLGISNQGRLPTHYELLAISLDEDDPDVIQGAAAQRRNFVESKRGEGHDDQVTEILYRIEEAESTLLNTALRRDYDRKMDLWEKRHKNRQVDPIAQRSRFRSRPGRIVGEDGGIVPTFVKIMAVICLGFGVIAWLSFGMWNRPQKQPEIVQAQQPAIQPQPAIQQPIAEVPKNQPKATDTDKPKPTLLVKLPRLDLHHHPNGWWSDNGELILGGTNGGSFNRKPLLYEGNESKNSIYMSGLTSSEVYVTYNIEGKFETFESIAYISEMFPEQGNPASPLVFKVQGDGQLLWKSNPLTKKREQEHCKISVVGIKELSLRIHCEGKDNWALGSWIEPRLDNSKAAMNSASDVPRVDPSTTFTERDVAVWVLEAGGQVAIETGSGELIKITAKADLPEREFTVHTIDLLNRKEVTDGDMRRLSGLKKLSKLVVMSTGVTDAGLQELSDLKTLNSLNVAATKVTGSGFEHLSRLESLDTLLCGGAPINDSSLAFLKPLLKLQVLGLIDTQITDAGIPRLQSLTALKELRLIGTSITDKAVNDLKQMKNLEKLGLERTKMTKMGVAAIRSALPKCEVTD